MASTASSSNHCSSPRILRCFCNCSELTRDEIESLINRNVSELLATTKGRSMFRSFLDLGHTNHQSGAKRRLLCYEQCERLIDQTYPPCDDDVLDLQELCPSYRWEQRLDEALDQRERTALVEFCTALQHQAKLDIEQHTDFQRFRTALRDKLRQ